MRHIKGIVRLAVLVAAASIMAAGGPAAATTRTWTGSVDNEWYTTGNWTPAGTPAFADDLYIYGGSPQTSNYVIIDWGGSITFDGPAASGTFDYSHFAVGFDDLSSLTIRDGAQVAYTEGRIGSFGMSGGGSAGAVTVDNGTWNGSAPLYVGYDWRGTLSISNGGQVENTDGYIGRYAGSTGTVTVEGGTWTNSGSLYVGHSGSGELTISSHVGVGGGDMDFIGPVVNDGTVNVAGACTATFYDDVSGAGSFGGTGTVVFLGAVSPGSSPAQVNFGGDVVFGGAASLEIELGGTAPGTEHDVLEVTGAASLDGTLAVSLINAFEPQAGDEFEILTYGSRSGEFASTEGWQLPNNLALVKQYEPAGLTLTATYHGDATLDFCVDGLDYVVWSNNYLTGDTWQEGDLNGDGITDGLDYVIWSNNYWSGCPAAPGAVPEPATMVLLAVGGAGLLIRRRKGERG